MNILNLPLKKQWYDMIARGEKLEEYREINAYWLPRLVDVGNAEYARQWKADGRADLRPNVTTNYDLMDEEGGEQ